jgi:hypothetical protein
MSLSFSFRRDIELTFEQAKLFNKKFVQDWDTYVRNAPAEWKKDKWFTSRTPVGITSRYGQNHHVSLSPTDINSQKVKWADSRDFKKMRNISWAGATHVEYVLFTYWLSL